MVQIHKFIMDPNQLLMDMDQSKKLAKIHKLVKIPKWIKSQQMYIKSPNM